MVSNRGRNKGPDSHSSKHLKSGRRRRYLDGCRQRRIAFERLEERTLLAIDPSYVFTDSHGGLSSPNSLAVGDFDSDGFQDVVISNYTANTVSLYYGSETENGTFNDTPVVLATAQGPSQVLANDVDDDGDVDILCSIAFSGGVSVFLNTGTDARDEDDFLPQAFYATGGMDDVVSRGLLQ